MNSTLAVVLFLSPSSLVPEVKGAVGACMALTYGMFRRIMSTEARHDGKKGPLKEGPYKAL